MASKDLNRYIKEVLKFEPRILSMAQMEILIEYDAWLDEQRGLTQRVPDVATVPLGETKKAVDSGLPLKVDE
jgi:hypothetical protein